MRVALVMALALAACAPRQTDMQHGYQERVTDVVFLGSPCVDNPVEFGESLRYRPDLRQQAIQRIEREVGPNLPGVRFLVVQGPVLEPPNALEVPSYRTWDTGGHPYAVLGWWCDGDGALVLPGLSWEVTHLERGVNDSGQPVPP